MSSSTDLPTSQGSAGTARIDTAQGAAGTAQIDADMAGPAGTARIDATAPAGPAGTARIDAAATGPAGTARVDAGTVLETHAPAGTASLPAGGAPEPGAAQHLMPGQAVTFSGRQYRVESTLSTTTSEARTYVVTQGGQRHALKLYRPGVRAPLSALAAIQARPHANVVALHDHGQQEGQAFEILEYFPAGTLDQLLRRDGPLKDLARLRLLVAQIADGLQHLHEQVGLIYQDLKPENVLISGPGLERVALADFGISTLRKGAAEVVVTANGTREYAAPELARFGNETQTLVSEKVDYFALGITLLECWQGTRPFQGIPDQVRMAQIRECEVVFPSDMDASLETLIKGLLSPSVKQRFGLEQVRRWVADLPLEVDYTHTQRVYERLAFRGDETFETPAQLAALLEKYPELGVDYLFVGTIGKWLDAARDVELGTQIGKIVRQFDQDDAHRRAGLLRAIYTLDLQRQFVSHGGRTCVTTEDLGDALLAERDHYVNALTRPFNPFYLYLQARGEGEFAANALSRFIGKQGAAAAFNQLVFDLHSDGRLRLKLGDQAFLQPEELREVAPAMQEEVVRQLKEPSSRLLLWLQKLGVVEQVEALDQAKPVDQLAIAQALPWLDLRRLVPNFRARSYEIFLSVLRARRLDLLEEFVRHDLDFNASKDGWRPLVVASCWGRLDEVRFMLDHGADIDVVDKDGDSPLSGAIHYRRPAVVELLLQRGARLESSLPQGQTLLGRALTPHKNDKQDYPVDPVIVGLLLKAGADANAVTGKGLTPLQRAVQVDPPEQARALIGLLVEAGADPNGAGADGSLALHLALAERRPHQVLPVVEELLARGADPLRTGHNHLSKGSAPCDALFMALYSYQFKHQRAAGYLPVIERLLKARPRLDALNQGKAPLHWAAMWGDEALVKLLLEHGAQRLQVGDGDMLPATYARMAGAQAVEKLLAPPASARWVAMLKQLAATLLRSWAVMLVLLSAVSVPLWVQMLRVEPTGYSVGMAYGQLLLCALALQALLPGDSRTFGATMKNAVRTLGGWIWWLVLAPALLGALAAGAATMLGEGIRDYRAIGILQQLRWPLFIAAMALCVVSARFSARANAFAVPHRKYAAAESGKKTQAGPARRSRGLVLVLAGLFMGPTLLLARLYAEGSLFQEEQPVVVKDLGPGHLLRAYAARDARGGTVCTLAQGTALSQVREVQGQREALVRVAKAPGACGGRLPDWIRLDRALVAPGPYVEPGRKQAPPATAVADRKAPDGPAPTAAATPRQVAGTVSGLSSDGWPVIDGKVLPLEGVAAISTDYRGGFTKWLAGRDNHLRCERREEGTYRCLTNGNVDAAEALLLNGAAQATADASAAYKDAMAKAMDAKRGQWK